MRYFVKFCFLFLTCFANAQETPNFSALDSLYREDQFYVGITYNIIQNKSVGISQGKFTPSFSLGFLRDMPVSKNRHHAIAVGLGYSINNFNHNLSVKENNNSIEYALINTSFDKNKQILHYVDLPIEFRWRNSTPESHKFYRIYLGFKASYLVYNNLNFEGQPASYSISSNNDFNKLQYGTYICLGNNVINFYAYYGLNSVYRSGTLNNENLKFSTLNLGFMFYIL